MRTPPRMHPIKPIAILILFLTTLSTVYASLSPNDLSLAPRSLHSLSQQLTRRQTCGGNITAACETSLQDCIDAICTSCANDPSIAQCCALSSATLVSECIANSAQGATQSSIPTVATTPTTTDLASLSSELASPDATACVNLSSIYDVCSASTSGFTTEPLTQRASCLCYTTPSSDSTVWAPSRWDGLFSSCLGFYSTANASVYSSVVGESDFPGFAPCSSLGDVLGVGGGGGGGGSGPATTSATTTENSRILSSTSTSTTSWHFIGTTPASSPLVVMTTVTMTVGPSGTAASSGACRMICNEQHIKLALVWSWLVAAFLWKG